MSTAGFYPASRKVGNGYADYWRSTTVERLALAARRVAAVINRELGRR